MFRWFVTDVSFLFVAFRRPELSQDGQNRVLQALHHKEHHYKKFIQPELLELYSFEPESSEDVLSQELINQQSECSEIFFFLE
jgi:hypothetical protein